MGQVTLVVEKCGCYVQQNTHKEEEVFIVYCPQHKAAPEMYEALKAIMAATTDAGAYEMINRYGWVLAKAEEI